MGKSSFRARHGRERDTIRHKNSNSYSTNRRKTALANLNKKLNEIEEKNKIAENSVDLSKDKEYQRIKKEINTLESKI